MTSRNFTGKSANYLFVMALLLLLAACGNQTNDPLPTVARIPTETNTPLPPDVRPSRTEPPTFTPTFTATASITPTATITPLVSDTPTVTPSSTITDTPSPTPTITPTFTPPPTISGDERALFGLLYEAINFTPLPTDFYVPEVTQAPNALPTQAPNFGAPGLPSPLPPVSGIPTSPPSQNPAPTCSASAQGGFATIYNNRSEIANALGCPVDSTVSNVPAAWQLFQNGVMIWLNGDIYVLYNNGSRYQRYQDNFVEGVDPETSAEPAPQGLYTPVRGFLKIWSSDPAVRNGLGYATIREQGTTGVVQNFDNGRMVHLPNKGDILVFVGVLSGTWQSITGQY